MVMRSYSLQRRYGEAGILHPCSVYMWHLRMSIVHSSEATSATAWQEIGIPCARNLVSWHFTNQGGDHGSKFQNSLVIDVELEMQLRSWQQSIHVSISVVYLT
jgi:hypothetical protein